MIIFYSWQSDLPNNLNRTFIEDALNKAVKRISKDDSLSVEPNIDRDTSGVPGAPDITATILDKIDKATVFVADVSIINSGGDARPTPNPNVLVELGYALKAKGWNAVILVQNMAFGDPETLPFDLRAKRTITYFCGKDTGDRSGERNRLTGSLEHALRLIISQIETRSASVQEDVIDELMRYIKSNQIIDLTELLERRSAEVRAGIMQSALMNVGTMPTTEELVSRLEWANANVEELARLFIAGAPWAKSEQLVPFSNVLEELARWKFNPAGLYYPTWCDILRYPALRLLYAGGVAALARGNYEFLRRVFLETKLPDENDRKRVALIQELNAPAVFSNSLGNQLPGKERHLTPASDYLHESLRPLFSQSIADDHRFTTLFDRFEYLLALVHTAMELKDDTLHVWVPLGSFMWRHHGSLSRRINDELDEEGETWPPLANGLFPSMEVLRQAKAEVDKRVRTW